jgi:ubiquinone biosynthesis protein
MLEVLQDQVTPQSFEDINEVLQREFGAGAHELFAEFEDDSTAAASLAQVRDS